MTPGARKPAGERDYGAILLRAVVLANDPSPEAAARLLAGMEGLDFGEAVSAPWREFLVVAETSARACQMGGAASLGALRHAITAATGESPEVPAWRWRKDIFE